MGIPRDSGRNIPEPFFDAFASPAVTTGLGATAKCEFSLAKCENFSANGDFCGLEMELEKVAAHETFAQFLRLYM
jgi:hypothetical protein